MTTYPTQTDLTAIEHRRFSDQLDRTASTITAAYISGQITPLIQRHATPTELISRLRDTADRLEETGIR